MLSVKMHSYKELKKELHFQLIKKALEHFVRELLSTHYLEK